jgi:hypothetical protein
MTPLRLRRPTTPMLALFVGVALLLVLLFLALRLHDEHAARVRGELRADSALAVLDTTRALSGRALEGARTVYGDSLRVVERLSVQQAQRADALDRALGTERQARVTLSAQVAALHAHASSDAPVEQAGDSLRATFHVEQSPYHIDADVVLPLNDAQHVQQPRRGTIGVSVRLDPAPVVVRLSCATPATGQAIRAASVQVAAPPWLSVDVAQVEQAPEVCNARALAGIPARPRSARRWGLCAFAGYGATVSAGLARVGPTIGAGLCWRAL